MEKLLLTLVLIFSFVFSFSQDSLTHKLLARELIQHLIEKKYDKAELLFNKSSNQKYNAVNLKKTWLSLQSQTGIFKTASSFESEKIANENYVIVICEFQYITLNLKTTFDSDNKISSIFFLPSNIKSSLESEYISPAYLKKRRIKEQEIYLKTDVFLIPGVLTRPKCKRKPPLVILVHDFGPLDRDASIGPNKIFKDIALGLSSKGIAVLRYDKRSFIYAARMAERYGDQITIMEETIADAITAINLGKSLSRINHDEIYIIGHSLGGMVAPRIAS
ncbi:MAG: DUF3887 domain-containing protein, partial [Bacteroidota bacterium]|nr:DUF3887 domain-containing protein [Bacteroidota bacterium]